MRIAEVETFVLRLPEVGAVCDGSQDAFVVRIRTDEGISGLGEGDSMPTVLAAAFDAPISNSIGQGLRSLLIGQDPLQIEPLCATAVRRHALPRPRRPADSRRSAASKWRCGISPAKRSAGPFATCSAERSGGASAPYASLLFPEDPTDLNPSVGAERRCANAATRRSNSVGAASAAIGEDDVALVRAPRGRRLATRPI